MPKVIDLPTATTMANADYFVMESSGGGTKKITKANALSEVGSITMTKTQLTSIASGTLTNMVTMSLSAGTYILLGQFRMASASGNYIVEASISNTSATGEASNGGYVSVPMTTNVSVPSIQVSRIATFSATTTIYLVCAQHSGSSKTVRNTDTMLTAIRIK